MKKNVFLIAVTCAVLTACDNKPSFHVEGEVKDAAGKMLYFEQTGINGIMALDSVKLDDGGTFSFKGARPEAPDFYRLRVDDKVINFAVDSTETVTVKADLPHFTLGYEVEGPAESKEVNGKIKELVQLQAKLQESVDRLSKSGLPVGEAQDSLAAMLKTYKKNVSRNYIFKEPDKTYAYFALFQEVNGFYIFDPLNNREDVKCFAAVATSMNQLYPHADRSRNLYNMVIKGMKNTRKPRTQTIELPSDKMQEASIIDIPLRDVEGKLHHLTELKGKVVLIDFTVYGNEASAGHNLALRDLYNKYASQGFQIYQVSLDADEHFWKTAADNLPWICVHDPDGSYSTYVNLYRIDRLPTAFLVNRAGELSHRIGEKDNLEEAVKRLL